MPFGSIYPNVFWVPFTLQVENALWVHLPFELETPFKINTPIGPNIVFGINTPVGTTIPFRTNIPSRLIHLSGQNLLRDDHATSLVPPSSSLRAPIGLTYILTGGYTYSYTILRVLHSYHPIWQELAHHTQRPYYIFVSSQYKK